MRRTLGADGGKAPSLHCGSGRQGSSDLALGRGGSERFSGIVNGLSSRLVCSLAIHHPQCSGGALPPSYFLPPSSSSQQCSRPLWSLPPSSCPRRKKNDAHPVYTVEYQFCREIVTHYPYIIFIAQSSSTSKAWASRGCRASRVIRPMASRQSTSKTASATSSEDGTTIATGMNLLKRVQGSAG